MQAMVRILSWNAEDAVTLVHDTVKEPYLCAKRLATEALTRGSGVPFTDIPNVP